jgi:hypothetical protein
VKKRLKTALPLDALDRWSMIFSNAKLPDKHCPPVVLTVSKGI